MCQHLLTLNHLRVLSAFACSFPSLSSSQMLHDTPTSTQMKNRLAVLRFHRKKNNRIGMRHYVIRPQSRVVYSFSFGVAAACTLLFYQFVNFDKYRSYRFVVPILLSMCDQNRMARTNVFIKTFCNTVRFGSRIIVRHHVYVEPWKITNLISQSSAFGHIKYEYTAKRLLGWLKRCLATILSRLPANSFGECRSCAADPVSSNNNANCSNCNYGYIMCWANTRPTR